MDRPLTCFQLLGQVSALVAEDQSAAAETGGGSRVYFYNAYGPRYSYSIYQYQV